MASFDYRIDRTGPEGPVLYLDGPAVAEQPKIGEAVVNDESLLDNLTDPARDYITKQVDQFKPSDVNLVARGSEVNVVLRQDQENVSAFMVPTKDSDPEAIDEFEQFVNPSPASRRSGIPEGVPHETWERRLDAVRDAAREMDPMDSGDAREFLKGRAQNVSKVDIEQFLADVREQRLDDLADVLDTQIRSRAPGLRRARRQVRVVAPRGWTKRAFSQLSDAEVAKLMMRLEGRGWDEEDLKKYILGRVKDDERTSNITGIYNDGKRGKGIRLSDIVLDDGDDEGDDDPMDREQTFAAFSEIARALPAPVVNVHIDGQKRQPMRHIIQRGEDGFITDVIAEPIDEPNS